MNAKRKNRSNSASSCVSMGKPNESTPKSPRSRTSDRTLALDGVYNNSYFMNSVAGLVGNFVKIHTATASVYEGIFRTFSAQFEIVIEMAHKVDPNNPFFIPTETLVDKMIFKPQDIIKIEITDTDLDYATRDTFQTDTAISKFNGQVTEKELEPWDCSSTGNLTDDFDLDGATSNGWDVNDMFRQNEQMYGVTSNFDHGLSAYTTPLQNKDSKDYKDAEAKAAKIAYEIESNPHYKVRVDLENGDEEEKYAAVARPPNSENNSSTEAVNKYICPPKRKTLPPAKHIRTSPSLTNQPSSQPQQQPQAQPTQHSQVQTTTVTGSKTTSTFTHHVSSTHTSSRERVNGVVESPKPQRTPTNARHGRSFGNSDNNRFNNSNGSLPTTTSSTSSTSNLVGEARSQATHTHSTTTFTNSLVSSSSSDGSHHKKPPLPLNHSDHNTTNSTTPTSTQRKTSRGREDAVNDFKKFSSDFKLNDSEETKKTPASSSDSNDHVRSVEANQDHSTLRPVPSNTTSQEGNVKVIKSKLNPNAKEFVYNPNAKPFTPRTASTPNQSRPHTPQTPGYGVPPMPAMVMSTYVVTTAQSPYSQQQTQPNRFRKVQVGMSQPSQMQVAAATGQPLLTTAPMHTPFTVPYTPQPHIAPQPFQQMVRMVAQQSGGMVPPVITAINYPPEGASQAQMQYMGPGSMGPHPHHAHHPHVHQGPNNASSPQANNSNNSSGGGGGGGSGSGAPNGSGVPPPQYPPSPAPTYSQPPPPPPQGPGGPHPPNPPPHTFPIMCPILPPHPATHNPHHMMAAAAAQSSVQQYIHHHPHQHSTSGNLYHNSNQINNIMLCNSNPLSFM